MNDQEAATRVTEALREAFGKCFGSMTGQEVRVEAGTAAVPEETDVLLWEQSVSGVDKPCLWIRAGRELWTAAGQLTLAALGIEPVADEDCRSTWQEIVSQMVGAFCTTVSSESGREVAARAGQEIGQAPQNARWTLFRISVDQGSVWHLQIGWTDALLTLLTTKEIERSTPGAPDKLFSKTFDLLLDVPLPVSVSFGRTSLELREVLKLSTGSVVELNRFVAEPVEVIVNDCIIARGEVVVVDGNYGVRITQLSSREDRLKFGMSDTSSRFGTPLR